MTQSVPIDASGAGAAEQTAEVAGESALALRGLTKSYGEIRAVDGLDLAVGTGAICALLGPSGCGKTTTLRLIAGLEEPDAGTIEISGRRVAGAGRALPPEKRGIGMVFQDYALFPHHDIAGNVGYALGRRPEPKRVAEAIEIVGLEGLERRRPHELSGGQQQRVALARALVARPQLVLLDEPFSNLDATLRVRVRREVREILVQAGVTAVFVTHDQEEALSLADSIAVMDEGRIQQVGTPEEIYGRPATRWVAEFLGEAEVLPGDAADGFVECALARVPADPELRGPVDVLVRPESINVGTGPPPRGHSSQQGEVVEREFYGHDQLLHVRLRSGLTVRARSMGFPAWHPGDHVKVWLEGPVNVLPRD